MTKVTSRALQSSYLNTIQSNLRANSSMEKLRMNQTSKMNSFRNRSTLHPSARTNSIGGDSQELAESKESIFNQTQIKPYFSSKPISRAEAVNDAATSITVKLEQ